VEEDRNR